MSERPRALLDLGAELERVARETLSDDARAAPRTRLRRWLTSRALPLALLVALGGGAVALASGLISFGKPAASNPVFSQPDVGLGKVVPGSVRLVPISAADPAGGPRWGMRVFETTRGAGCMQIGRLVDGKLVALGQDGAFDDDGRAHALPLSAGVERQKCALLDGRGRIFDSVTLKTEPASAAPGEYCVPPGTYAKSRARRLPTCPLADERDVYFGLLGPDAQSITYTLEGETKTVKTVGADGAYLLVGRGTTHRFTGVAGRKERDSLSTSGVVPVYSPISAIGYDDGAVCHLVTADRWIYGSHACSPTLQEPYGYAKPVAPTPAQLATQIQTKVVGSGSHTELAISFKSRIAVLGLRGSFEVISHERGQPGGDAYTDLDQARMERYDVLIPQGRDVAAGETVSGDLWLTRPVIAHHGHHHVMLLRPIPRGTLTGEVVLRFSTGTEISAAEGALRIPVGRFEVKVP